MPILTLQRQLRQLGRIRTGVQVPASGGKKRPAKIETFRLTSPSRELIEAAAQAFDGTVKPWQNPGGGPEFEVITARSVLDILIPPGQPVSQWYEMWSGGGCQRRCDGITNVLTMTPCECPEDIPERIALAAKGEACKATTRLNVILPELPDLGSWMLESHGFYAAVELKGAAEILVIASASGHVLPARLRLDQREKKVPGQPTNKYAVPVIEFLETRMADLPLLEGGSAPRQVGPGRPGVPALPATTLPPGSSFRGPDAVGRSVAEPEPEVALSGATVAPSQPRAAGPDARVLCGDPSAWDDGTSCNLAAGHLEHPGATQMHRVLDDKGVATSSWPVRKPAA